MEQGGWSWGAELGIWEQPACLGASVPFILVAAVPSARHGAGELPWSSSGWGAGDYPFPAGPRSLLAAGVQPAPGMLWPRSQNPALGVCLLLCP